MKLKIEIIFEFSLENDSNVYRVSMKIKKKKEKNDDYKCTFRDQSSD